MINCKAKEVFKCATEKKKWQKEKYRKMLFIFTSEHTWRSTSLISTDSVLEFQAHVWWHHRWWYANLWLNRAVPKTCRMPGKQREEIINCFWAKLLMQNSKVFFFYLCWLHFPRYRDKFIDAKVFSCIFMTCKYYSD